MSENQENTVGVLTMAGSRVEVLLSPSDKDGQVLAALHDVPISGKVNLAHGVRIGHLALKHRTNKAGAQRMVIFVGSPVVENETELTQIAKILKKDNVSAASLWDGYGFIAQCGQKTGKVSFFGGELPLINHHRQVAVDVISFGETDVNENKLNAFVEAIKKNDNSNLVSIPPGVGLVEALTESPVLGGGISMTGTYGGDFGGFQEDNDPDLAYVLKLSEEEYKVNSGGMGASSSGTADVPSGAGSSSNVRMEEDDDDFDDEELQKAIAMSVEGREDFAPPSERADSKASGSRQGEAGSSSSSSTTGPTSAAGSSSSRRPPPPQPPAQSKSDGGSRTDSFRDPEFVRSIMEDVKSDTTDPQVKEAMERLMTGGLDGSSLLRGEDKKESKDKQREEKSKKRTDKK